MVAFKLLNFGGMLPAVGDTLLPDTAAAYAENCWLYSGNLEAMRAASQIHQLVYPTARKVYRIPKSVRDANPAHVAAAWWMEFDSSDTDVIRAPVKDDTFERFYWACDTDSPRYAPKATITAAADAAGAFHGSAGYLLGIPTPAAAPALAAAGGVSGTTESRAYVYTWVSAYGEEGPPSPPTLVTCKLDDTVTATLTAPTGDDTTGRNLTKVRIYRTVTSSAGVATYYFVAEQDIATLTYDDAELSTLLVENNQLQSTGWTAPPDDLKGWVAMPNGMIAGWRGKEIWFSEPYRPHAWPAAYTILVDADIVGLGVTGQSLIVCTDSHPWAVVGGTPAVMSQANVGVTEPCMARGSIISTPEGVYFVSPNGVVLAADGVVRNVTRDLLTKSRWLALVDPPKLRAARLGVAYLAWGASARGCFDDSAFDNDSFELLDFTDAKTGIMVDMVNTRVAFEVVRSLQSVHSVTTDEWIGEIFTTREDGWVYWHDLSETADHGTFTWKSKVFQTPDLRNFAAMRVYFTVPSDVTSQNVARNNDLVQELQADQYGLIRVYADGVLKATRELRTSGELLRLPSGFKAQQWQLEIEARVIVTMVKIGESAKELDTV